ncbi:MAG TPA: PIG-L family deacetylase [Acidimicrobiia bacterium]|nr:PIG-L family deacetylase [Acidimicrobiia bacterium]
MKTLTTRRQAREGRVDVGALLPGAKAMKAAQGRDEQVLVLSPHFDDAVLSCGAWLSQHPGAIVATVCSGHPGPGVPPHEWDGTSGFPSGDAAATVRRGEDAAALEILGARQVGLGFLDGQYRQVTGRCHEESSVRGPFKDAVAEAFCGLVDALRPTLVLCPMGLLHQDHIAIAEAAWSTLRARPRSNLIAYLDLPSALGDPAWLDEAEDRLRSSGLHAAEFAFEPHRSELKERAVACYTSQLEQLGDVYADFSGIFDPGAERFVRILLEAA